MRALSIRAARRRLVILVAVAGLLSMFATVLAPSPALAAYGCDNVPQGQDHDYIIGYDEDNGPLSRFLVVFYLKSWKRVFNVAGSDTDGNDSDFPQNKTFTITNSKTYSVSQTERVSGSMQVSFLTTALSSSYERSSQLTQSYTTSDSVTYQETLTPHVAKKVYNGVDAIDAYFDLQYWYVDEDDDCWWRQGMEETNVFRNVPTSNERRDIKQLPTINPGGVVDGVTYDRNIKPCETVAIFGNGFEAPSKVLLRQGDRTWTVGAGTPWFYESWNQINATIPCDVPPNDYVSVSVESNKTHERLETLWPRFIFLST